MARARCRLRPRRVLNATGVIVHTNLRRAPLAAQAQAAGRPRRGTRTSSVDTDRLAEEKARGMSIELGYAPLRLPGGRDVSVVDVPGHGRFVRTMVAGATGIGLFLARPGAGTLRLR